MNNQVVVVLTMGRSGSSALAGALNILGVDMGRDLGSPHPSNPKGPFEDRQFMLFSEEYLKSRGMSWYWSYGVDMLRPTGSETKKFRSLVKEKNKSLVWGWKNPRTLTYIKWLGSLLPNPLYLWIYRDKPGFMKSLIERDGVKEEDADSIYDHYIKLYWKTKPIILSERLIEISFSKLVSESSDILLDIGSRLGLPYNRSRFFEARQFIDPNLKHW